jgi:hypothetical protein
MTSGMVFNNCMYLVALLLLLAGFWDTKPAEEWSVEEVRSMFEGSPWSRTLRVRGDPLQAHLASALPMRDAEKRQRAFQKRTGAPDASFAEYLAMMEEGEYIVLAVKIQDREKFADGVMVNRMQKDTQMRIGKKSYPLFTHFPPSSSDSYLRLVFKRPTLAVSDKSIFFAFVVPGVTDPYRNVEFYLKEMEFRGKLAY